MGGGEFDEMKMRLNEVELIGLNLIFGHVQVTPVTPASAAVTARAKMTTIPIVRRTKRNVASSRKWPPTSSGRGSSSI